MWAAFSVSHSLLIFRCHQPSFSSSWKWQLNSPSIHGARLVQKNKKRKACWYCYYKPIVCKSVEVVIMVRDWLVESTELIEFCADRYVVSSCFIGDFVCHPKWAAGCCLLLECDNAARGAALCRWCPIYMYVSGGEDVALLVHRRSCIQLNKQKPLYKIWNGGQGILPMKNRLVSPT